MEKSRARGPAMPMDPQTPLHAYAPGALSKLTPAQRGRALKRSKRPQLNPALVTHILS